MWPKHCIDASWLIIHYAIWIRDGNCSTLDYASKDLGSNVSLGLWIYFHRDQIFAQEQCGIKPYVGKTVSQTAMKEHKKELLSKFRHLCLWRINTSILFLFFKFHNSNRLKGFIGQPVGSLYGTIYTCKQLRIAGVCVFSFRF